MMHELQASLSDPVFFPFFFALIGLAVGSFLNVVIYRLPKIIESAWQQECAELRGETLPQEEQISLARPRSRCPHCGHMICAIENIPVLSWLFLRGKCSACRAPISVRYPLVELTSALLTTFAAWHFGFGWQALGAALLIWALIALSLIDYDTQLLPDIITLPLLWAGLLFNLSNTFSPLSAAVIGAMAGYLSLWLVYWGFKLLTGKEGMGYGDFKLLAALGAWMGWQMLPLIILMSAFAGAVIGITLILLTKQGRDKPMPFGPYLAIAGFLALFWGQDLTQLYFLFS